MLQILSSRMPLQQVAKFSDMDLQALSHCVCGDFTLKTAPRNLLESAMPGKHARVDAIVTAFQGNGLVTCVLSRAEELS